LDPISAAADGVYVVGLGNPTDPYQSTPDYAIHKIDPNGTHLWTRRFSSLPLLIRALQASATSDGLYVMGQASEYFLRKHDNNGNVLWTRQVPSEGRISSAVDGVYFWGYLFGSATSELGESRFLRKYDPNGNELWNRPLTSLDGSIPQLSAAVDGVYLNGVSNSEERYFEFLSKYDRNGNQQWTRHIDPALG
jgi:outer membrane protein assembly factor BamB